MDFECKEDHYGAVNIPTERWWGIQTQRNKEHFKIGRTTMPAVFIQSLIQVKRAAAIVNASKEVLSPQKKESIVSVCDLLLNDLQMADFPLRVYQTGSGTQTNMNVNEVIANHCRARGESVHPNDDVNQSQSSNDVFPTAMNLSILLETKEKLLPILTKWEAVLSDLEDKNKHQFKLGRTHLQDATPMTFGQEISGWHEMIRRNRQFIELASEELYEIPIGGTAVGTGLNTPTAFSFLMVQQLSIQCHLDLRVGHPFYGLSSHSAIVFFHGALKALATDLMKIANDIRLLSSGPRTGFGEIQIPSNEAGSSIMPGKVNPTQVEALTMAMCTVMGNDVTIQMSNSQGQLQLNVYKPVILDKTLESLELLSEAMTSFLNHCLKGIVANRDQMIKNASSSLMLVTALTPYLGYDCCEEIARYAVQENISIEQAALSLGHASKAQLTEWLNIDKMI